MRKFFFSLSSTLFHLGWFHFTLLSFFTEYKRYKLGVFWLPVIQLIFISGLVFIFRPMSSGMELFDYAIYVGIGLISWNLINGLVTNGLNFFKSNKGYIHAGVTNLHFLQMYTCFRHLLIFIFSSLSVIPLILVYGTFTPEKIILLLISMLIWAITAVGITHILALVSALLPDLSELISGLMRVMFFVTPVFWSADGVGGFRELVVLYNPFYHYINIIRGVLLGSNEHIVLSYIVTGSLGFALFFLSAYIFERYNTKLANQI